MKTRDRYLKLVEWSEEDQCYVGTCPSLMMGGIHGDDEMKVYGELCQAVDEWIKIYEEDGEPLPPATVGKEYSGKFVIRTGQELHKELSIQAMHEGQSLNSYCVRILQERFKPYKKSRTSYSPPHSHIK
jgi:predicted HicB family RNase H-like nuclease